MKFRAHGGGCCGMSQIYEFGGLGPLQLCSPISKWEDKTRTLSDIRQRLFIPDGTSLELARHMWVTYRSRMLEGNSALLRGRPLELAGDRLIGYLQDIYDSRPAGCIEVVLADYADNPFNQYETWEPFLLELGFKEALTFVNSNTKRTVHVYHFVYDQTSWMADRKAPDTPSFKPDEKLKKDVIARRRAAEAMTLALAKSVQPTAA